MRKHIMFMVVGILISSFIIILDDKEIVFDSIVDSSGTPAWEFAFVSYMLFLLGGVITDIIIETKDMTTGDVIGGGLMLMINILVLGVLETSGPDATLQTAFSNIATEFYDWYVWLGLIYAVFLGYIFIRD
jgi:hypothetical protein